MKINKRLIITIICFFSIIFCMINGVRESIYFNPKITELFYNKKIPIYECGRIIEDKEKNLYIGQDYNKCIQKFDEDGNYIMTIGIYSKSVEDFYIDKDGLLHVFSYIKDMEEKVIDTNKRELVRVRNISEDEDIEEIIMKNINLYKTYEVKNNKVYVKNGSEEYIIKLKDMPSPSKSAFYNFFIAFLCFMIIVIINNKYLNFFDFNNKNYYRVKSHFDNK